MNDEAIAKFAQGLRGPVIGRNHPEYEEARKLYNAMIDKRPLLIARCADVADVIAAVNFGRDNKLPIAIRGGGHNGPGLGSVDDGLVIDLSTMKGVRVDPKQKTVRVGPGCTTGDVDHATQAFGQAVPFGVLSTTGVAGPDAERRSRLPQPPVRPRGRQPVRGGRGSGRRQLRHRFRDGERGPAVGSARRRRKFRRRDQLPLPHPSGEHDLRRADRVRTRRRAHGDEMVPAIPAKGAGGILHFSRAAVGPARRSVSQGALVEEDVRARRVAQRAPLGGREGRQRGPRGPAEADHRLGPADALHGDPDAVRPAAAEGPAMVLEGRLRERTAGRRC